MPLRLGRGSRRVTLLVHRVTALGRLGTDIVLGVLAVTGFAATDPALAAACYTALHTFAVPVLLHPRLVEAARQARDVDPDLAGHLPVDLLFPAFVSGTALLAASVLAIWKPWGPTRRGVPEQRRDTAPQRTGATR